MKIVSLQSVGIAETDNDGELNSRIFEVGRTVYDTLWAVGDKDYGGKGTRVVAIKARKFTKQYRMKLANGHIMVLPADHYIAEYASDEDGEKHD